VKTNGWGMLNMKKYTTVLIDIWPGPYQEICEIQENTKIWECENWCFTAVPN